MTIRPLLLWCLVLGLAAQRGVGVLGQNLACMAGDYAPVIDRCVLGTRHKTYAKRAGSECMGPDTVDLQEFLPCTCGFADLVPQFTPGSGQCNQVATGGVAGAAQYEMFTQYSAPNCTVPPSVNLQALVPSGVVSCPCTADDIAVELTACANGLQRRIPYWKRDCRVDPGVLDLPPASWSSCATVCRRGQVIGAQGVCEPCPAGTLGATAKEWVAPYRSAPTEAFLSCNIYYGTNTSCPATQLWSPCDDGTCLTSGSDPANGSDNDMMFLIDVSQFPATLSFDVTVSSEPYFDYFVLYLDSKVALTLSGEVPWATHKVPLPEPATPLCMWTVESFCMYPNQLAPYLVRSFFDASVFVKPTLVPTVLYPAQCPPSFKQGLAGQIIFLTGAPQYANASACSYAAQVRQAFSAGAGGVIFATDDVVTGASSVIDPGVTFVVASVPTATARTIVAKRFSNGVAGLAATLSVALTGRAAARFRLTFSYSKDPSVRAGNDMARIRNIIVDGAAGAARCISCPVGSSSVPGAASCTQCPLNTIAPVAGQPKCTRCPSGTGAPIGSSKCLPLPDCGIADFTPVRSPCAVRSGRLVQNFTTVPVSPPRCNLAASGYARMPPMEIPCDFCPPGMFRSASTGRCEQCAPNEVGWLDSRTGNHTCTPCPSGQFPSKSLIFSSFNRLHNEVPDYVSVECTGCLGAGWAITDSNRDASVNPGAPVGGEAPQALGSDVFSVGPGVLPTQRATMTWRLTTIIETTVDFNFMLLSRPANARAHVVFTIFGVRDGRNVTLFETTVFDTQTFNTAPFQPMRTNNMPGIEPGPKYLQWIYYNDATAGTTTSTSDNIVFAVTSLEVPSATVGAASSCAMCLPGYECPDGVAVPQPCVPGMYANAYATKWCHQCPAGSVSSTPRAVACPMCAPGTEADSTQTHCAMPKCALTIGQTPLTADDKSTVRWARTPLGRNVLQSFDFSHFAAVTTIPVTGLELRLEVVSVKFSLCSASLTCGNTGARKAYACGQASTGDSFFLGDYLTPRPLRLGDNDTVGIAFEISGAQCHAAPERQMMTILNFLCDPSEPHFAVVSARSPTPCIYNVTVRSSHACPICTNASFVKSATSCSRAANSAGSRELYYSYARSDGVPLDFATCVLGEPLPPREVEECPWMSFQLSSHWDSTWAMAFIMVFIAISLVGCAGYFWHSHRKLYSQYNRLQANVRLDNVELNNASTAVAAPSRRAADDERDLHARPHATAVDPARLEVDYALDAITANRRRQPQQAADADPTTVPTLEDSPVDDMAEATEVHPAAAAAVPPVTTIPQPTGAATGEAAMVETAVEGNSTTTVAPREVAHQPGLVAAESPREGTISLNINDD